MMKQYTIKKNQHKTITLKNSGDYLVNLAGEGASVDIHGSLWLKNKDKLSLNLTIIHQAKNTAAITTLKAIADDSSIVELNGTVIVKEGAQLANSLLTQKVLILSDNAQAHAIPNLEIEANDVKCSHAATVSNIDQDQLFYLMSRGIKKQKAKHLIAQGFLKA